MLPEAPRVHGLRQIEMHFRDRINNRMVFYEHGPKDPIDRQQKIEL